MKMRSKGPDQLRQDTASYMVSLRTLMFFTPECAIMRRAISACFLLIYNEVILAQGTSGHWLNASAEYPQYVPISRTFLILFYEKTFSKMFLFYGPKFIIQLIWQYLSMNSSVLRGCSLGQCSRMQLCNNYQTDYGLFAESLGYGEGGRQNQRLYEKNQDVSQKGDEMSVIIFGVRRWIRRDNIIIINQYKLNETSQKISALSLIFLLVYIYSFICIVYIFIININDRFFFQIIISISIPF